MLGYDEDQIGDSPEEWFGRVHPLDAERVRAEIAAHLVGADPAAPDRAPDAPRRRDLPLGPHPGSGRAGRPGDGRPHGGVAVRHHPAQGGRGPAATTTPSTTP